MESHRHHGEQDDEQFLPRQTPAPVDSPTVGPLRIQKNSHSSQKSRTASAEYTQDVRQSPQSSRTLPSQSDIRPPYPEDGPSRTASRQNTPGPRMATPDAVRGGVGAKKSDGIPQRAGSSRYRFKADDPGRPSISGYGQSPPKPKASRSDRGTPKPLPESPGPETPDKDEEGPAYPRVGTPQATQEYYPPPVDTTASELNVPEGSVNRMGSTASVSTTKAERGSPPPPETPIGGRAADGRFVAIQLPRTADIHAQHAAASQRASPYQPTAGRSGATPPASQAQPGMPRPWSPSERPGASLFGPHVQYQGIHEVQNAAPFVNHNQQSQTPPLSGPTAATEPINVSGTSMLAGTMGRMGLNEEPPPAYSSVHQPGQSVAGHPTDKRQSTAGIPVAGVLSPTSVDPNLQQHPAFANDPQQRSSTTPSHPAAQGLSPVQIMQPYSNATAAGPSQSSPPPLPEGWISHLDPQTACY